MGKWTRAAVGVLAVGVALAGLAAALQSLGSMATDDPERLVWSGPIRAELGRLPRQVMREDQVGQGFRWRDGRDVTNGAVDFASVGMNDTGQPSWRIELAAWPPPAAGLGDTLISYGLVFDTTGDGVGDYVVGINNDAPRPGDFRVWVTDVASGATEEQIGGPYGIPIEFSHPNERERERIPGQPAEVVFTFLGDSAPPGLTGASPFYAWASLRLGGEVVAWDYAPDASWVSAPTAGG